MGEESGRHSFVGGDDGEVDMPNMVGVPGSDDASGVWGWRWSDFWWFWWLFVSVVEQTSNGGDADDKPSGGEQVGDFSFAHVWIKPLEVCDDKSHDVGELVDGRCGFEQRCVVVVSGLS